MHPTTDQPAPSNADRAVSILLHASDTLAAPDRWTKGVTARSTDGQVCHPDNEKASVWCVLGAMERAYHHDIRQYPDAAIDPTDDSSPYRLALLCLGQALPAPFRVDPAPHRGDEEGIARYTDDADTVHQDIVDLMTRAVGAADRRANMLAARQQAISS